MGASIIQEQHDVILHTVKSIARDDWKVLVVDEAAKRIIDNVLKEDELLNQNIANIEKIEDRREMNPTMDAIYILSPQSHIVDCLLADLDRRRYKSAFLVWTALLEPHLRRKLDSVPTARQQIAGFETLSLDFFPRESHVITFRDPWSFPILYHPACNNLVREHMQKLAQKITDVCVSLGEYPKVRYYRPRNPTHEAGVLCSHLARFVQEELDTYAQWNKNFPPPSSRPPGILVITDRSMDIMAPLVHEFTYQAMAHDLLPIQEGDKVTFRMKVSEGGRGPEEKEKELHEKDNVWVDNRHRHMKDTIDKLMEDFRKFIEQNPHFTNENPDTTSLNAIKDMLAGLPQFQEMKEAYSLHLSMAQECMNAFETRKLPDVASVEQTLVTGLDEDYRKPKNVLDQVVRLLDDEAIIPSDRLRLVMLYILYREGVIPEDVNRLLAHSSLPPQNGEMIANLELLGGRIHRGLKEPRPNDPPLFPADPRAALPHNEEYALSRFETAVKQLLDHLCRGTLDQTLFPYVKPPLDPGEDALLAGQAASLRAAKPSWAGAGRRVVENRQRVVVFMAGGATYSESRACYEASQRHARDVFLATSHMLTPQLFVRQLGDLSADRRRLDLPAERPKPQAPAHLFERERPPPMVPPQQQQQQQQGGARPGGLPRAPGPGGPRPGGAVPPPQAPAAQMASLSLNGGGGSSGARPPSRNPPAAAAAAGGGGDGKLHKAEKEKKKRNIFGMKK